MSRRDEVSKYYDISNRADVLSTWMFWINVIFSIGVLIFQSHSDVVSILMKVIIVLSFVCPTISLIDDSFWWFKAESVQERVVLKMRSMLIQLMKM